jgi:hypothetical protein
LNSDLHLRQQPMPRGAGEEGPQGIHHNTPHVGDGPELALAWISGTHGEI